MKKIFSILFLNLFLITAAFATHMRAGEITYKYIPDPYHPSSPTLKYEFTILTYTNTQSPVDRTSYEISWGDNTTSIVPRIDSVTLPGTHIRKNIYVGTHTFPAPATYIISLEDQNRSGGVLNIPNSINVPFYIQTVLVIDPFLGPDNSPELQYPPIDNGCVGVPFLHNPGAFDPDGDSLSFKLINCKGEGGLDIPGYTFPQYSHSFGINHITGDLIWDSPVMQGEYNVAILIEEYRNGTLIGSVTRDMQITITTCNDHPPVVDHINDTCVLEGTLLQFRVYAHDPDSGNVVTLSATGGPLIIPVSPAIFTGTSHADTTSALFSWQTECAHVREQPYQMIFKATDNSSPVHLFDLESMWITVVAPAPPNLVATPMGNNINLIWNKSPCTNAIGYKIYRRNGFYGYVHGNCETGVPACTGYVEIASDTGVNDTTFTDTNNGSGLIHGIDYCYMVVAYFSDGAESYASNEACTTLIKDVPIITNVSVNHTDASNGSIYIAWSKPSVLDTTHATGPYKYFIYHSNDFTGSSLTILDSLSGLNDTTKIDTNINTVATPWSYRIDLWNETPGNRFLIGTTQHASSIYLTIVPNDNQLKLNFSPYVPWANDTFVIYRKNNATLTFDSIGYSVVPTYTDTGLVNGRSYCYKVKSIGNYFAPGIIHPIINYSQEVCGVPIDHTAPCPPVLNVIPNCDEIKNTLIWTDPNHSCANDVILYHIYYSPVDNGDFALLTTINGSNDTTYIHQNLNSIAGCYMVTAVDSFYNESIYSNLVCLDIDSCNIYHLPNIFTPNNDGVNDLFIPFPYNFVKKINLQIFNRWGKIVFTTEDPNINWDGKDKFTKLNCSDGVYFYVCDVYEYRLAGLTKRTITGCVHLLR